MTASRVLVTDCDLPGTPVEDALSAAGIDAVRPPAATPEAFAAIGADVEALVVQWARITGEVMDTLPNLRIISRLGIGYDMIDVDAATARGIAVANTPSYCIEEVAAHTVAMIMAEARGLASYDRAVREGTWRAVDAHPAAVRPSTTTVSVLGFGRIGSLVARSLRGIGFRVLVADPYAPVDAITAAGCDVATIAEAIAAADVLTLHVPLTAETHHLINAAALATMRAGAVIVNTCRGPLIDEEALVAALDAGTIAGAALDVFAAEPLPAESALRGRDDVLLTPHAAWYSPEALVDLPIHAAQNVIDFLSGSDGAAIVNRDYGRMAAGQ